MHTKKRKRVAQCASMLYNLQPKFPSSSSSRPHPDLHIFLLSFFSLPSALFWLVQSVVDFLKSIEEERVIIKVDQLFEQNSLLLSLLNILVVCEKNKHQRAKYLTPIAIDFLEKIVTQWDFQKAINQLTLTVL